MSKQKTVKSINQSMIDHTKDAKNASNGFKSSISSGTEGLGDNRKK